MYDCLGIVSWNTSHGLVRLTLSYCLSLNSSFTACLKPLKPLDGALARCALLHLLDSAPFVPVTLFRFQFWYAEELFDRLFRIVDLHLLRAVVFVLDIYVRVLLFLIVFVLKVVAICL